MSNSKIYKLFLGLSLILILLVVILSLTLVPRVPSINFLSFDKSQSITENSPTFLNEDETLFAVNEVIDGDTIKVDYHGKTETVRLIGLDAPEINGEYNTCYAEESKNFLTTFVLGKKVRLESDKNVTERDKYNRLLRYVHLGDININQTLIRQGYAEEVTYNIGYKYDQEFREAQLQAFNDKLGIWSAYCADSQ